jgi:hypothetical protein
MNSAQVNKSLIVILVVLLVAGGGFWVYRWQSTAAEKKALVSGEATFKLWCNGDCKDFTGEYSRADAQKMGKDASGMLQCPKCQKFTGSWGGPSSPAGGIVP